MSEAIPNLLFERNYKALFEYYNKTFDHEYTDFDNLTFLHFRIKL
jgi:hypothetical protein